MSLFNALQISTSAMAAERLRIETTAENLANMYTTRTSRGGPYRRKIVGFVAADRPFSQRLLNRLRGGDRRTAQGGVIVTGIYEDPRPFQRRYAPGHPDADAEGYVALPNVDPAEEMVNLLASRRAYEANVAAFNVSRTLAQTTINIGNY